MILDRALSNSLGVKGIASFLRNMGYQTSGRLVIMKIQNVLDYRSKPIEVITKDGAIFSASDTDTTGNAIQSRVKLAPIDPGKETTVYIFIPPWLYFEKAPISVLHDGKLVDVTDAQLPDEADQVIYFVAEYPFVIGVMFVIGLVTSVIFFIVLVVQLFFGKRLKTYTAKHATKDTVKPYLDFIALVKEHNPKILAEAEIRKNS